MLVYWLFSASCGSFADPPPPLFCVLGRQCRGAMTKTLALGHPSESLAPTDTQPNSKPASLTAATTAASAASPGLPSVPTSQDKAVERAQQRSPLLPSSDAPTMKASPNDGKWVGLQETTDGRAGTENETGSRDAHGDDLWREGSTYTDKDNLEERRRVERRREADTEIGTMSLLQWMDISALPEGQFAYLIKRAFFAPRFPISACASGAVLLAICVDGDPACSILRPKKETRGSPAASNLTDCSSVAAHVRSVTRFITELHLLPQKASARNASGRELRMPVKKHERAMDHGTALADDCELLNVDGVLSAEARMEGPSESLRIRRFFPFP
ncbi:hypothetical protein CGC21_26290 [Leishmania donovani]|uniref:Uncharacterized protein n=1 Tax=Leishmania donovani TaxID=5661 RepID=A0A504WW63_LEIDO|nr:hypothetical protein CGC21_26290 [Leishmania donovani]